MNSIVLDSHISLSELLSILSLLWLFSLIFAIILFIVCFSRTLWWFSIATLPLSFRSLSSAISSVIGCGVFLCLFCSSKLEFWFCTLLTLYKVNQLFHKSSLLLLGYSYYLVMDAPTVNLPFPKFYQVRVLQIIGLPTALTYSSTICLLDFFLILRLTLYDLTLLEFGCRMQSF